MKAYTDSHGRKIITTGTPPSPKDARMQDEMITTNNIERVLARKGKDEAAGKAEGATDGKK